FAVRITLNEHDVELLPVPHVLASIVATFATGVTSVCAYVIGHSNSARARINFLTVTSLHHVRHNVRIVVPALLRQCDADLKAFLVGFLLPPLAVEELVDAEIEVRFRLALEELVNARDGLVRDLSLVVAQTARFEHSPVARTECKAQLRPQLHDTAV